MKIFRKADGIFPSGDRFRIWIEEGWNQQWAVYVAGEDGADLLCVTDREGAEAVQALVENFVERLIVANAEAGRGGQGTKNITLQRCKDPFSVLNGVRVKAANDIGIGPDSFDRIIYSRIIRQRTRLPPV